MDDRYSSAYRPVKLSDCKPTIQATVLELQSTDNQPDLTIYQYGQFVAVRLTLAVSLPSRGPVNGIDVRRSEPVLIFFHEKGYPGRAPQVRVDRRSFPAHQLPHLNPVLPGEPPWLCLHRGNLSDWYAEHSILDLVERARGWLEDAAKGQLIKESDRFEPTRFDPEYWLGASVFDQQQFRAYITERWRADSNRGVAYVASYLSGIKIDWEWIRLSSDFIAPAIEPVIARGAERSGREADQGCFFPGILFWPDSCDKFNQYFGALPNTLPGLYELAQSVGIPLQEILVPILASADLPFGALIPLFLCIQRPLKLIGSDSNLEILSFVCLRDLNNPEKVGVLPHRDPLTPTFARHLSGLSSSAPSRALLLGCGALGSKIGLHLGREGLTELTPVDGDSLSPHNLVRNALLDSSRGLNKAYALETVIREIYRESHQPINITSIKGSAFDFLYDRDAAVFKSHKLVIDATASISVFAGLVGNESPHIPQVVRCEMADGGRLGIMLVEGRGRSPKLDDLRASLYDLAIEDAHVERWLRGYQNHDDDELGAGLEDITIGLGCSSPTMRVSDDLISFHAVAQAVAIRNLMMGANPVGGIQLSAIGSAVFPQASVYFRPIDKFRTLLPHRVGGWRIRIRQSVYELLVQRTVEATPNETGGILIGLVARNQKTIFITRQLDAPNDSEGYPYAFKMGVNDIPDQIRMIMDKTGNLIRYVGEWHSHPKGSSALSAKDRETAQQLRRNLNKIRMPTLIMIVAPSGCYYHLFLPT